jgi:cyclic pyranopterin phosphate synthase
VPAEGLNCLPDEQLLTGDELGRLLDIAVTRLGITKVRFTGSEPSTRRRTWTTSSPPLHDYGEQTRWRVQDWTGSTCHSIPLMAHASPRSPAATDCRVCLPASAAGLGPVKVNAVLDVTTGRDDARGLTLSRARRY